MRRARAGSTRSIAGFTLVEVLVVVVVSTGIILALTLLYRTTGRAAQALQENQGDWAAEQFLRAQMRAIAADKLALELFSGKADEVVFVSRRGAAAGFDGPPVLARYRLDAENRVTYAELPLPGWWRGEDRVPADALRRSLEDLALVPTPLLAGTDNFSFAYRDPGVEARWLARWNEPSRLPALVRVSFTRAGRAEEIVLETGYLLSQPFVEPQ